MLDTLPTDVRVRLATVADAPALARLNAVFNQSTTPPEHIAEHIVRLAAFETPFLAEVGDQAAGMVCLRLLPCALHREPWAELTELYVDPAFRRRGVGRALVAQVVTAARAGGAHELALVTAWRNTEAHAFYHAVGFRLWCITMRLAL